MCVLDAAFFAVTSLYHMRKAIFGVQLFFIIGAYAAGEGHQAIGQVYVFKFHIFRHEDIDVCEVPDTDHARMGERIGDILRGGGRAGQNRHTGMHLCAIFLEGFYMIDRDFTGKGLKGGPDFFRKDIESREGAYAAALKVEVMRERKREVADADPYTGFFFR